MLQGLNNQKVLSFNQSLLLHNLYIHQKQSAAALAKTMGLSVTAVCRLAETLIAEDKVEYVKGDKPTRGRSSGLLTLKHHQGFIACLNVRPTAIDYLMTTEYGEIVEDIKFLPITLTTKEDLVATLKELIATLHSNYPKAPFKVAIAMHGQVDYQTGVSLFMPQAPWHSSLHLKYLLQKDLGIEVLVDNDCVMRALAQKWALLRSDSELPDLCVINIDYGVGSAFLVNGSIFRGPLYSSGQIGHTIVDPNGRICSCGRVGCLETIASAKSLQENINRQRRLLHMETALSFEELLSAYQQGDLMVMQAVDFAALNLGRAIYNFLNVININHIYLYGRMCEFGAPFLSRIREQALLNPFDDGSLIKSVATSIELGTLSEAEQLAGIGFLYAENTLLDLGLSG